MSVYCSKCGISQSYYIKNNMNKMNCRYHSVIKNNVCTRCGSSSVLGRYSMHNCYHDWQGPFERWCCNISYTIRYIFCFRRHRRVYTPI